MVAGGLARACSPTRDLLRSRQGLIQRAQQAAPHDLRELSRLPACALRLRIASEGSGHLADSLKRLAQVQLQDLVVSAPRLTIREQRLVARCAVRGTLALDLDPGSSYLKFVPRGCKIVHGFLEV